MACSYVPSCLNTFVISAKFRIMLNVTNYTLSTFYILYIEYFLNLFQTWSARSWYINETLKCSYVNNIWFVIYYFLLLFYNIKLIFTFASNWNIFHRNGTMHNAFCCFNRCRWRVSRSFDTTPHDWNVCHLCECLSFHFITRGSQKSPCVCSYKYQRGFYTQKGHS